MNDNKDKLDYVVYVYNQHMQQKITKEHLQDIFNAQIVLYNFGRFIPTIDVLDATTYLEDHLKDISNER